MDKLHAQHSLALMGWDVKSLFLMAASCMVAAFCEYF